MRFILDFCPIRSHTHTPDNTKHQQHDNTAPTSNQIIAIKSAASICYGHACVPPSPNNKVSDGAGFRFPCIIPKHLAIAFLDLVRCFGALELNSHRPMSANATCIAIGTQPMVPTRTRGFVSKRLVFGVTSNSIAAPSTPFTARLWRLRGSASFEKPQWNTWTLLTSKHVRCSRGLCLGSSQVSTCHFMHPRQVSRRIINWADIGQ